MTWHPICDIMHAWEYTCTRVVHVYPCTRVYNTRVSIWHILILEYTCTTRVLWAICVGGSCRLAPVIGHVYEWSSMLQLFVLNYYWIMDVCSSMRSGLGSPAYPHSPILGTKLYLLRVPYTGTYSRYSIRVHCGRATWSHIGYIPFSLQARWQIYEYTCCYTVPWSSYMCPRLRTFTLVSNYIT